MFQGRIMTIQDLNQAIVDEVEAIDVGLRRCVFDNFYKYLQELECIDVNEIHLPM